MIKRILGLGFVLLLIFSSSTFAQDDTLLVMGHDSFNVSEEVISAFEKETGIQVELLLAGDAGTMVNQAVLSRNNPQADVIFGIDNTFLSRALEGAILESYTSPLLENIPTDFVLDERVTPIDFGDVCLNYDVAYFADKDLPTSLQDLTDEAYQGLLVVQNPALSSPGLAFLLLTVAEFGSEGEYTYLDFWADLVENEVKIAPDWTSAYYGDFTVAGGGEYPLVVSYASSPPAEVFFADPPLETAPTGSITADGMCFRQIEFAGILRGTKNRAAAEQFIDFMLSPTFQEDMPLQMFVFPLNPQAQLPQVFQDYAAVPENPVTLSPQEIEAGRDEWIEAWTETVLR